MVTGQFEHYRNLILNKRSILLHSLDLIKESGLYVQQRDTAGKSSVYGLHTADQGTDTMEQEQAFIYAAREENLLYHLDLALERIAKGEYGICVGCGKPIASKRLEAVPHARLCITCKSQEEKTKA